MKPVPCLVTASLIAAAFSVYALPHRMDRILSATRSFSWDGKWYSVGKPSSGDSLIRKELSRRGFDITRIPQETTEPGVDLVDTLSEIPPKKHPRLIPFPSTFRAENSLQMESVAGFIDITYGNVSPKGGYAKKELAAKGWKFVEMDEPARPFCIATIRKGRETSIVLLEEKEGSCLFLRQLEK